MSGSRKKNKPLSWTAFTKIMKPNNDLASRPSMAFARSRRILVFSFSNNVSSSLSERHIERTHRLASPIRLVRNCDIFFSILQDEGLLSGSLKERQTALLDSNAFFQRIIF
jgi:hypothetical protein